MVTRWGVCVCVCARARTRVCACVVSVGIHIHKCLKEPGEQSKDQEEKDEDMRCWDHRENCSLALTWWKVSPGPWAGPCLCTDAQSQVQESDQGCRHLTTTGDGIQSQGRDRTHGHRQPEGSLGHGRLWAQSLITGAGQGRGRTRPGAGAWVLARTTAAGLARAPQPLSSHQKTGAINTTSCCGLSGDPQIHTLTS